MVFFERFLASPVLSLSVGIDQVVTDNSTEVIGEIGDGISVQSHIPCFGQVASFLIASFTTCRSMSDVSPFLA